MAAAFKAIPAEPCQPASEVSVRPARMSHGVDPLLVAPRPEMMGLALSVASALIVSVNLLVTAALARLLLKRRSQSWCFVLNLALADTLVGVSITGLATEDFHGPGQNRSRPDLHADDTPPLAGAKARCLLRMAFVVWPCTASILSMLLISLDRYAAIKMPLRYSLLSGKSRAAAALLVLWSGAALLGFSPVMVKQLQSRRRYDGHCAFFSVIDEVGIIALCSACFFPLLCLFLYVYLDILRIACSHQRQILRAGERPGSQHCHLQARSFYWSHVKALRTVGLLVGCFLLLWCPFFVVCVVHTLCERCGLEEDLESSLFLLGLSNSLINPLVYAFWQRELRLQLVAIFSCGPERGGSTPRCDPPELSTATRPPRATSEGHVLSSSSSLLSANENS